MHLFHKASLKLEPEINQGLEKRGDIRTTAGCWRQANHLGRDGHWTSCTFHGQQAQFPSRPRRCAVHGVKKICLLAQSWYRLSLRKRPPGTEFVPFVLAKTISEWLDGFCNVAADHQNKKKSPKSCGTHVFLRGICNLHHRRNTMPASLPKKAAINNLSAQRNDPHRQLQ